MDGTSRGAAAAADEMPDNEDHQHATSTTLGINSKHRQTSSVLGREQEIQSTLDFVQLCVASQVKSRRLQPLKITWG